MKYKFIKVRDDGNEFDISDIEFTVTTEYKPDLLEEFGRFLQACGFSVEGDIIEEEDYTLSKE